ncbi:MAG: hypothetical protein HGB11_03155 [Chlorobiales bacterium]|nr:hypothetical protein [Chlorobiales bacterium]
MADEIVSRYMDLSKFMSLLEDKGLFFCQVAKLEDEFEGTPEPLDVPLFKRMHCGIYPPEVVERKIQEYKTVVNERREDTFVCCWYRGEAESEKMWREYGKCPESVCIHSTKSKLKRYTNPTWAGNVIYDDRFFEGVLNIGARPLEPFFYKKEKYRDENEYRLLISYLGIDSERRSMHMTNRGLIMNDFQTDLNNWIDSVIISPFADPSFKPSIEKLMKTYGINKPVWNSELK